MKPSSPIPDPQWHHLPRLPAGFYRGFAAVFWTITLEHRAQGWLDAAFHQTFRELMLHAAAREGLACPTYVLMPDHMHLVWLGLRVRTDQRRAMRFLRKRLREVLDLRSPANHRFVLQKQSHDTVLKERDRTRGALASACFYILDNPHRKQLVEDPATWPYTGAVLPGYPFLHPWADDFWPQFWPLYHRLKEPAPKA